MNTVKLAIIGLGARAETLLATLTNLSEEAEIVAICDCDQAKIERFLKRIDQAHITRPATFINYHELLKQSDAEALLIPTSWNSHLRIACDCIRNGKYAAIEVGGASSLEELWQLVHASETTGTPCMMLENCCYSRNELLVLNMVRQGMFGELIHCECGYEHDLGDELIAGLPLNQERSLHNLRRQGDLYPTHGLGPIAKILKINRGNRLVSLVSVSSKARRLSELARKKLNRDVVFNNGDVTTTILRCANGETITMTHGVALPRPYSRDFRVQGTRGIWLENSDGIYIEGVSPSREEIDVAGNPYLTHSFNQVSDFYERYDHPIWRDYDPVGGHGGMDALALRAFLDAVRRCVTTPIDVYDIAAWMSVTVLSEQSAALGGIPMAIPDFTNGKWIFPTKPDTSIWSLN